ncbi:MAG: peptidase family C69 [Pseudomonadota bacterium]
MCDTLAVKRGGAIWFAKNSDREPGEEQRVEIHPPAREASPGKLRCTYIEIEQAQARRGVALSRPSWMWGAEMGVNDAGVAIGNEAVFSKSILKKGEALLGMDLVRLGLERAASAEEAASVIIALLERWGQGGGAGYRDRNFRYDNSFLIADKRDIIVLETAGREWAMKKAPEAWSISNTYTLGADFDRASHGAGEDFKGAHETFAMPRLACAADRRAATVALATSAPQEMSLTALAGMLRRHAAGDGFDQGSNRDVCMHASGLLRPHASTTSMIVRLSDGPPRFAFTGTLQPCISLFKPATFEGECKSIFRDGLFGEGTAAEQRARREPAFREAIRRSIAEQEPELLGAIERGEIASAERLAAQWSSQWLSPPSSA